MNTNTATAQSYPDKDNPQDKSKILVTKYASIKGRLDELKMEQKILQTELESVEVEIINYAKGKNIQQIFAGDDIMDIKEKQEVKFPYDGENSRIELEEIIKKAGAWDNVSTLSLNKLKSFVWDYRDTHKELVKELSNFQKKSMKTTVKVVKLIYNKRG